MNKSVLFFILLALVVIADVILNELGFGAIAFVPLTLLACWLMFKAFEEFPTN